MKKKNVCNNEDQKLQQEPDEVVLKELEVRAALPEERQWVHGLLEKKHYLGASE